MLGAIAGSRTPAADGRAARSRDPRRRQIGRQQSARLPRRLRRRARQSAAGENPRQEEKRRRHPPVARTGGGLDLPGAGAGDRAWKACGGWCPIRAPPTRGSISTGSSRSLEADEAAGAHGKLLEGGRAPSRRAHVLRRRGAGGAGQDRARAHGPHRARGIAREGRAVLGARFPQARHRGDVPAAAVVPGAADPACCRAPRLARPRLFRHGDQLDLDLRLFALPDARQAARAAPLRPPLQAGAEGDRGLARADRRGGAGSRPTSRSKSPNARG